MQPRPDMPPRAMRLRGRGHSAQPASRWRSPRARHLPPSDRPTLLAAEVALNAETLAELDALDRAQQALGQLEDAVRAPLSGPETSLR